MRIGYYGHTWSRYWTNSAFLSVARAPEGGEVAVGEVDVKRRAVGAEEVEVPSRQQVCPEENSTKVRGAGSKPTRRRTSRSTRER